MSLAQRSVRSITWNTLATLVGLPISVMQSILIARLLPIEYFGVFAAINSLVSVCSTFFEFGLSAAYIHRSQETEDETQATAAFFTLRLVFDLLWAIALSVFGWFAIEGLKRTVLVVLVLTGLFSKFTVTPRILLIRRVEHRRIALLDLATGITNAVVSITIALIWHSIWALLVSSLVTGLWGWIGLYIWRPVWKPKLFWDKDTLKYFLSFGGRTVLNNFMDAGLENIDNLWTSFYLGDLWLGYYSRAFRFAIYPRILLSSPVNTVVIGTYSELKYDRRRLSEAFFQANFFLTRAGFLVSGWLAIIAPQFISLLIGDRWLPMLLAFRLMLIFSLLDPIKVTISGILQAVGRIEKLTIVRFAQIMTLVAGLFAFGFKYKIAGVALAVDLMILIGTGLSLWFVRSYVDFSLPKLFLAPALGLTLGIVITAILNICCIGTSPEWLMAILNSILFCSSYVGFLFVVEKKDFLEAVNRISGESKVIPKFQSWLKRIYNKNGIQS